MKYRKYLPGVSKRLLKLKVKRFGTFTAIWITVIVVGISGNMYLKSKDSLKNTLFYQPEDKVAQMTIQSNALSNNISDLTRERDALLLRLQQQEILKSNEKPVIIDTSTQQKPITNKKIKAIAHNLGGVMTGHSAYLYNKCIEYDVNPLLAAAIIIHESGNGTSVAIRKLNNIAGFMGSRGLMRFDSIRDSIDFMVILLKEQYIDKGFDSIDSIQKKYCPVGAENDPTGLNKHWLPMVADYYNTLVKESV